MSLKIAMPRSKSFLLSLFAFALILESGCGSTTASSSNDGDVSLVSCTGDAIDLTRPDGWTIASHCAGEPPDYARLFDDTSIRRLDITISAANYAATQADLESLYGGSGGPPGPPGSEADPIWVPTTVSYEGLTWSEVGMRYKGNSSLRFGYQGGIGKLPFRLDFDEFEAGNPTLLDQRFWGFKKMTFANGHQDTSFMRDKLAATIFRSMNVPAASSTWTQVFVDVGDGPVYWGLYTMIEDISDELLGDQLSDHSGNLYKPEGAGARLATFDQNSFPKKTNEDLADWSDVQGFIAALNAPKTDVAAWRTNLEAVFDVDGFLRYMATNQAMQNWDTYGWAPHNYYLYADPAMNGRIRILPWDLNESLKDRTERQNAATSDSILLDEIGSEWPLIRSILDDATYLQSYKVHLQSLHDTNMHPDTLHSLMDSWHNLVDPYVVGADGEAAPYTHLSSDTDFTNSLTNATDGIKPHIDKRLLDIEAALSP